MYFRKEKLLRINLFYLKSDDFLYYSKDNKLVLNGHIINDLFNEFVIGGCFLDFDHCLVDCEKVSYVITKQLKILYSKKEDFRFGKTQGNISLSSVNTSYDNEYERISNWILFDYYNNKEIKSFSFGKKGLYPHYFYEDRIVFQEKSYLIKCLSENGTEWTNDISDIGIWRRRAHGVTYREDYAIRRAVAVVNDVLWLDISKGVIMGIDTQTGKTLHVFKEHEAEIIKIEGENSHTKQYDFDQQTDLPEHPHTFYDEATKKIFGVHNHQYYEVDLQNPNPKLRIYDLIDEYALYSDIGPYKDGTSLVRLKAWSTRSCFDATHIYFIVDNPSKAQIVALNRQTLKIDWFYEFDDSGILMQIEVSSNNLYVLDNQSTLHIFEKEQS